MLYSHPKKEYKNHIKNLVDSFDDKEFAKCAFYHDFAKQSDNFQKYITLKKENFNTKEEFEKERNRLKTTHSLESAYIYFFIQNDKNIDFIINLCAILKHHSNLENFESMLNYLTCIENNLNSDEKISNITSSLKAADLRDFLEIIQKDKIYEFADFFDDILNEVKNFFKIENFFKFKDRYSKLILADKFEAIFDKPYEDLDFISLKICENIIQNIHAQISNKPPNNYKNSSRKIIFKNYETNKDKDKFIIKAPTGIGKTYIALELALKIATQKHKKRIITAIPFTSIIDQTFLEYEKVIPENLGLLKYHYLSKYTDDEKEQFSKKIFLADIWHEPLIITTFNQLLNIFFSNSNKDNLKLQTLKNSVIIVDEIQNISRVLLQDLAFVFNEFGKIYNIDFIIMSATMPHLNLENFTIISESDFYRSKQNRYKISFFDEIKNIKDLVCVLNSQTKSTLCVVNTIAKAQTIYKKLKKDENLYLLTTHQTPKHRIELLKEISKKLKEQKPVKLIATQLIEAGVDLDFSVGFREFAPFTSIVQMAGRVNRNGIKSKISECFVFDFLEFENVDKKLPYHGIDLQEEFVKNSLKNGIYENEIFEILEEYFKRVKDETTHTKINEKMRKLEFTTIYGDFTANFMPKQSWKVSVFIEEKKDEFKEFIEKRDDILNSYDDKFEALAKIKDLEKTLLGQTININHKLIENLQLKEIFGRYILNFGFKNYTKEFGFTTDLTIKEEAFS